MLAAADQTSVKRPRASGEDQQNPFLARQPAIDDKDPIFFNRDLGKARLQFA
jgi:hypothetical protein